MSSSAVATLMTFVLRLSHGKCFKTGQPPPHPFRRSPKLLLCAGVEPPGWQATDWRPVSWRLPLPPAVFARTAGNRLICTGFFPDFPTVRGRNSRKGCRPDGQGKRKGGSWGAAQGRELLIKVLSPRCWQNEQVDKDSSPASPSLSQSLL